MTWTRLPSPTTLARIHDQTADGFFCQQKPHTHFCRRCGHPLGRHESITIDMWTGWNDGYPSFIYRHLDNNTTTGPREGAGSLH